MTRPHTDTPGAQSCTPPRPMALMAHRGGGLEAPENTWEALLHTRSLGVAWMETDVRVTSDGVVVLAHDATLQRTLGLPLRIRDLSYAQLARIPMPDGRPAVRLDDALYACDSLCFNIDVKEAAVVEPALRVVRQAAALERVRFATFWARRLDWLRAREPAVRTSLGSSDMVAFMAQAHAGVAFLPAWVRRLEQVDALQVPVTWGPVPVVTEKSVAVAHDLGLDVHVWTVNDCQTMRELQAMGVDAIITDIPQAALTAGIIGAGAA